MDWVEIGSYAAVVISIVIMIFFLIKGYNLIYKDGDK